jgi:uncharacterized protein with von Willebrand factor type A (vWA) domain
VIESESSAPAEPTGLDAAVTRFCRALRACGLPVSPAESVAATAALELVDLGDERDVYHALRSVLTTAPEDFPTFDEVFARFWRSGLGAVRPPSTSPADRSLPDRSRLELPRPGMTSLKRWTKSDDREEGGEPLTVPRESDRERLASKDFSLFDDEELDAITRVARRIARKLAARPSRRWRRAARGARVDLRRSIRKSLAFGGEVAVLARVERVPRKTKLVLLCDVSGSMDLYSRFLVQFLYALQNSFARVETFAFSTRLARLTERLRHRHFRGALSGLSSETIGWSGGTRIGACLAQFEAEWGGIVDRRTIVVVISDGWDTGDPAQLGRALEAISRRAGRVVWLNPLLGDAHYEPLTRGMQAALPHVDVFAPAHNLVSLRALLPHLEL